MNQVFHIYGNMHNALNREGAMTAKTVRENVYVYAGHKYYGGEAELWRRFREKENELLEKLRQRQLRQKQTGIYGRVQ